MAAGLGASGRFPDAYTTTGISSFTEFLAAAAPELLPGRRSLPPGPPGPVPHGTTIVTAAFSGGVVMAGDRRATMGNLIAQRDMEKVFAADGYSVVGIAGTAGVAIELVKLFGVELEHYEKIEGMPLSLDGKANRLSAMIRGNLAAAMQGLAVLPLYAGFDVDVDDPAKAGRIFSYDLTGGCYEEHDFHAVGSGSVFAKAAMKKRFRPGSTADEAVRLTVEALYDAADDDSATGGPDMIRRVYPVVMVADAEGVRRLSDEEAGAVTVAVVEGRQSNPGG